MIKEKVEGVSYIVPLDQIPRCASNDINPEQTEDLNNRILYLDCEIERESLIPLQKMIMQWNREDNINNIPLDQRKPIKILIFSYGGSLEASLGFIDLCLISKTPIWTYNMGTAMSGGFFILLAGSKRFALQRSQALCHQGSASGIEGTPEEIKAHTTQYNKLLNILAEYVPNRTNISKELFSKKKKIEWFITGEEQMKYGIVNKMIENIDDIIC